MKDWTPLRNEVARCLPIRTRIVAFSWQAVLEVVSWTGSPVHADSIRPLISHMPRATIMEIIQTIRRVFHPMIPFLLTILCGPFHPRAQDTLANGDLHSGAVRGDVYLSLIHPMNSSIYEWNFANEDLTPSLGKGVMSYADGAITSNLTRFGPTDLDGHAKIPPSRKQN